MIRVYHCKLDPDIPNMVYVGRPSKWGNQFTVQQYGRELCLVKYKDWLLASEQTEFRAMVRTELRGKNLSCWCAPRYGYNRRKVPVICHAQWLMRVAEVEEENLLDIEQV